MLQLSQQFISPGTVSAAKGNTNHHIYDVLGVCEFLEARRGCGQPRNENHALSYEENEKNKALKSYGCH